MERQLRGKRSRGDVVGAAESREEVVESHLVAEIDRGQLQAHLVLVAVEQIVVANCQIKKMVRSDAVGIAVCVVGSRSCDRNESGSVLAGGAQAIGADGCAERVTGAGCTGANRTAEQSGLKLLVGAQAGSIDDHVRALRSVVAVSARAGNRTSNQAGVITPVKADPRPTLPGLILDVGRLIELLIVVDTEDAARCRRSSPSASNLGKKETRGDPGKNSQRREPVEARHTDARRVAGDL